MKGGSRLHENQAVAKAMVFLWALAAAGFFQWMLSPHLRVWDNLDYFYNYAPLADNLLKGRGFINSEGNLETNYPPGFPLILAGLFQAAQVLNLPREGVLTAFHLVGFACCGLALFALSELLWGRK